MGRPMNPQKRIRELENALEDAIAYLRATDDSTVFGPDDVRDLSAHLPVPEDEYTAKEREDAALICDMVAASYSPFDNGAPEGHEAVSEDDAADAIGAVGASVALAEMAQDAVMSATDESEPTLFIAEAAAWIRSGWSPGDRFDKYDDIGPATAAPDPVPCAANNADGASAQARGEETIGEPTDAELVYEDEQIAGLGPTADMLALENAALAEVASGDEDGAEPDALDLATVSIDDVADSLESDPVYSDA